MPKTLLLADDSITIQKVVGITFAAEDYQITAVDNGEDAIARARQMKPDIVLADVVMPRKNGYEVCEAIKADPELQRIPVLLLAGTFEAFDENRARAARADGHIAKPFESGALIAKVRELAEGIAPAAQPAAPARAPAPQPAPAPHAAPAAARPAAPTPAAPRPGIPGAAPPGARPTMPGAAPPVGFRPAGPGFAPPGAVRPAAPGAVPPGGFRPTMPGAAPPGVRPPGPTGAAMRPPGPGMPPGMGPRPGIFPGAPPAGARPTMPGARPPVQGPMPGLRGPMQPPAPAARPAAPFSGARAPAPAAPEHRARESFGLDFGPGAGARPPEGEIDFGTMGVAEKPATPAAKPGAAVRGAVPREAALEGAPPGGPAPIDLGQEEAGEVELAPMPAFVPPAAATGHQPEARPPGDAGEAALREALSKASLEVIERVVWEVVPQLAETIIRENLERLAKERPGA